jgi:MoaA/NifB/PqqE/SkfB family radical SAM enzyme
LTFIFAQKLLSENELPNISACTKCTYSEQYLHGDLLIIQGRVNPVQTEIRFCITSSLKLVSSRLARLGIKTVQIELNIDPVGLKYAIDKFVYRNTMLLLLKKVVQTLQLNFILKILH